MRITRIIRCMSLLGYQRLSLSLVKFLIDEVLHQQTLESCHHSLENFWVPALEPVELAEAKQLMDNSQPATLT